MPYSKPIGLNSAIANHIATPGNALPSPNNDLKIAIIEYIKMSEEQVIQMKSGPPEVISINSEQDADGFMSCKGTYFEKNATLMEQLQQRYDKLGSSAEKIEFVKNIQAAIGQGFVEREKIMAAKKAGVSSLDPSRLSALNSALSPTQPVPLSSPGKAGPPLTTAANDAVAHSQLPSTSTAAAPVQSLDAVQKNIEVSMKKFDETHNDSKDKVNWEVVKTDSEVTIKDADKNKSVLTVSENSDHMQVKFHEPTISERAAMVSISACESPITIDSRSLSDLKVLVDAVNEINKGNDKKEIKFSEKTMEFLGKPENSGLKDTHQSLHEAFEKQKTASSVDFDKDKHAQLKQ